MIRAGSVDHGPNVAVMATGTGERFAAARFPYDLRPHQVQAVRCCETAADATRCHLVLPPGSGKTLIGAEIARRLGRRTLVLVPNTAIQAQWSQLWRSAQPEVTVGEGRDADTDVIVLTYQSLATFDADADDDDPLAERLHPDAGRLLDRLATGPPLTIVLDEAHHLAAVWGEVLAELLDRLSGTTSPTVIALTATPRSRLTDAQASLTDRLFGPVLYSVPTPALVREGVLAPFRELVRFVTPSRAESEYLADRATRWRELTTSLLTPGFASTDFLPYIDSAWVQRNTPNRDPGVSWRHVEREQPDIARAVLRLHAGPTLVALPEGARLREEHRQEPDVTDWAVLIGDYGRRVLVDSADPADEVAWQQLRAGLRSVGWTLTRNGVRRGQSPVDKVLQRTVAKADAAAQIVHHEHRIRGDRLRAVIITDYERASATPDSDLRHVLTTRSGSAWEALAAICDVDESLNPVLVTGRVVAGRPSTMAALANHAQESGFELRSEPAEEGFVTLVGPRWQPRSWLPLITQWFLTGGSQVLIGTRGLLGEGWDAAAVTTLVDLTAATTTTSVVQVRGRAIRRDPADPDKAAHIWSVVAISDEHPRGDADYRRFIAKHDGFHAVDPAGRIVLGVSHVTPRCGPFAPPAPDERVFINADMLAVAENPAELAGLWGVGQPYEGVDLPVVQIVTPRAEAVDAPETAVERWRKPRWYVPVITTAAGGTAPVVLGATTGLVAVGAAVGAGLGYGIDVMWRRTRRSRVLAELGPQDTLLAIGRAVADALLPGSAALVEIHPDGTGVWRAALRTNDPAPATAFATALDQVLAPIDWPRYLVSRHLPRLNAEAWHALPDTSGRNRRSAEQFLAAWQRYVSPGQLLYTGSAEGAGMLTAVRGLDPTSVSTAVRTEWH